MKTLTALLVATLGMHTDSHLLMTGCAIVIIYLIVKK